MRKLSLCLVSVALAISATPTAAVSDEDENRTSRLEWQLGNECKPIDFAVELLNKDATAIGLKREAIEMLARSRLRAARIYDKTLVPYLYINIHVSGLAANVSLQFTRWLRRPDGTSGDAVTWWNGGTGGHGGRSDIIMQGLSQYVDEFIDKYLEANAEFCK